MTEWDFPCILFLPELLFALHLLSCYSFWRLTTFTFHILLFPCWEGWRSLYPVSIPQRTSFGKRIPEAIATEGRVSAQKSAGLLSLSVAKLEMWRHKQLNVYFLDRVCLKLLCHTRALDASPLHLSFPNPVPPSSLQLHPMVRVRCCPCSWLSCPGRYLQSVWEWEGWGAPRGWVCCLDLWHLCLQCA